ncbi:MAG: AMP-binding protein, partial [Planctomycetes bacterium]|nr:AMP-binding protein [Planctomycetota bacterium]
MNLSLFVRESARRFPDKPALIVGERVCTYGQLERGIERTAAALRRAGVRPGRKVALTAPNGPEFVTALMGILRAEAVAVPAASDMRTPERDQMIDLVQCEYQLARRPAGAGPAVAFKALDDDAARELFLEPTAYLEQGPPDRRLLDVDASNIRFTSGT